MQLRYFLGETALNGTTEMMWCFLIEQMTGSWQNLKNNSDISPPTKKREKKNIRLGNAYLIMR